MTLVELMISLLILSMIVGAMAAATLSAQEAFRSSMERGDLESTARRVVDRIAEELRAASRAGLVPVPTAPLGSSMLQYQRNAGWAGGTIVWSAPLVIALVAAPQDPTNGNDDDGDGLVDERCVSWTRDSGTADEISTMWACGVPRFAEGETGNGLDDNGNGLADEAGLSFVLDGDMLTVRLTLQKASRGGTVQTCSVDAVVKLRN